MTDKGSFVLDFKDKLWAAAVDFKDKMWAGVDTPDVYYTSGYFVTAQGRYVLTSSGMAYDFGSNGGFLSGAAIGVDFIIGAPFPLSSFAPPNAPASLQKVAIPSIVPLRPILQAEDGEVCNTCILRLETRGGVACVLIDVCALSLRLSILPSLTV